MFCCPLIFLPSKKAVQSFDPDLLAELIEEVSLLKLESDKELQQQEKQQDSHSMMLLHEMEESDCDDDVERVRLGLSLDQSEYSSILNHLASFD